MRNSQLLSPSDFSAPQCFDNRAIVHLTPLQWIFWLCEVIAIVDACDLTISKITVNNSSY